MSLVYSCQREATVFEIFDSLHLKIFKMNPVDPNTSISGFFAGRSILITGATGFMGLILVEKLLRSCSDMREIFLLMRPKKGMSIDERIQKMTSKEPFLLLREEKPEVFKKIIAVPGDTTVEGLAIPDKEKRMLIDRVSVIFHGAASVRFDDSLKKAVLTNTRSTRDMCILASQMKNLKVFCHISTAYCQVEKLIVEEKIYPIDVDWRQTITVCETVNENIIKPLTPKYIGGFPNTYTFSKRLAEQVINDFSHTIPMVVFRPSVVISTASEPIDGWINNFNGPVGLLIAGGKGVVRFGLADNETPCDYIPVDIATKMMIIAAWKRGIQTITKDPSPHVYNCSPAGNKEISAYSLKEFGFECLEDMPMEGTIWAPRTTYIKNETLYFYCVLLFHVLPAIFIDGLLWASGRKPMLLEKQRKIYIANRAVSYFTLNNWDFKNDKVHDLEAEIPPGDVEKFAFGYLDYDLRAFAVRCMYGAKKYLLGEDVENLEPARRHLHRMIWIDKIFRATLVALLFWMVIKYEVMDNIIHRVSNFIEFLVSDFQ